jgi:KTSC domain
MAPSAWTPVDETASAWKPVAETATASKPQPGILDREIPLDSYTHATESGLQSIGRGLRDAAKGTWDTIAAPPKDKTETAVSAFGPAALPLYRTLRGLGHTAADATQLVGAIHDINQSPDPTGTYAKVAQETAGQGAGQALLALGTEGAAKAAPAVVDAARAAPETAARGVRAAARGANIALAKAPGTIGGTAGAAVGGYLGGHVGAEVGGAAGAMAGREILPQVRIPGEGFGLPSRVTGGPESIPPEVEPPASLAAPAAASPAAAPAATPETAAPAAAAPKKYAPLTDLQQQINDALGGKPLQRGVSLKNQRKANALPQGFTPVDSSALKGYKYDPASQEFSSITNNGQIYTHGEVTPDEVKAFEDADSQGKAWNTIRQNHVLVKQNGLPVKPSSARTVVVDPATGRPEFSDVLAVAKKKPPSVAAADDADLTSLLQQSLAKVRTQKGMQ